MKRILVIGIGAGNPDHVTLEAIAALNRADVVFLLDKGEEKAELTDLRREICRRHIKGRSPRLIEVPSPVRAPAASYAQSVADWHAAKAEVFTALIRDELREGERGAFLVWGDPSLYDSTLRILEHVAASGVAFDTEVVPGVSSLHALTACHGIALNTIGESVLITTGRKLAAGLPEGVDTIAVLLEGGQGLEAVAGLDDAHIYWGAYLGTSDEVLVSGPVNLVINDIRRLRAERKAEKGWIMDTYLLRRGPQRR